MKRTLVISVCLVLFKLCESNLLIGSTAAGIPYGSATIAIFGIDGDIGITNLFHSNNDLNSNWSGSLSAPVLINTILYIAFEHLDFDRNVHDDIRVGNSSTNVLSN